MIRARLRILLRQFRFEATFFATLSLAAVAALAVAALRLPGVLAACQDQVSAACFDAQFEASVLSGMASVGYAAVVFLPVLAGLVVGIAIVGRELERGTATLAWSLGRSRRRWLLGRVAAIGAAVLVLAALMALAEAARKAAAHPGEDLVHSFNEIDANGFVAAVRGLAAFGVGILAGALMGRVLPALLLAGTVMVGCVIGVNMALETWVRGEAVVLGAGSVGYPVDRIVSVLFRDTATGALLAQEEVYSQPAPPDDPSWPYSVYEDAFVGVPGSRAPEYAALACALYGAAAIVAVGGSVLVVDRRRPS